MSLNKKVLAVAIVGAMASGSAFAADLSAPTGAIPAYFAKEIIASEAAPATLTTSASTATQLSWAVSYNFSDNEVRYVRLECSDNIEFDAATTVTTGNAGTAIGATNGLGTNVLTFSVTSDPTGTTPVVETDRFVVSGDHDITSTDQNVNCSVALYDQPSQAQAGGTTGLIQNTYYSGAYLAFAPSYELAVTPTTHIANVEAVPSFSNFLPTGPSDTIDTVFVGYVGGTSASMAYRLRDPDGPGTQTATFGVDGLPVGLGTMLGAGTQIIVEGDFSLASSTGSTPYNAAARGRVDLAGIAPSALSATSATFDVGNGGFTADGMRLTRRAGVLIPASEYRATLDVVAANPTVYRVTDITNVKIGEIIRNGTQLQAPLVQIPEGWYSRVVLTNTSSLARSYSISVLTEEGVTVQTGELTGTIPANGTKVIEKVGDSDFIFSGNNRATVIVNVAGPNNAIQGLYQIVNPTSGSISNHVMVRPGSN